MEELREKRPNAKIVLNSLLPMTKIRSLEPLGGLEFLDAERSNGRGPHEKTRHSRHHVHHERSEGKKHRHNPDHIHKTRRHLNKMHPHHDHSEGKYDKGRIEKHIMMEKEHNQRKFEKMIKKDKYNPTLHTTTHYKKHDWAYHHRKNPPLWPAVQKINHELHAFCKKNKHVMFYDATELFTTGHRHATDYTLLTDFISPRGHLTVEGYKVWLNEVDKTIKHMLIDKKLGKPVQDLSHKPEVIPGIAELEEGHP